MVFDKRICSDLTVLTDAGLGATAPTTETGGAGNRLSAIGAAPFSVLASKLADGKDTRANPAGFPTRRTRKPACGGTRKPHGTGIEKCVDSLTSNHPWDTFVKAR